MMADGACKAGDRIGDYRLEGIASEGRRTWTWQAHQISMQRPVMLEMLTPEAAGDPAWVAAFLADVRAKALAKHPGIGTVYEAISNEEGTFFARERLEGVTLEDLHDQGARYTPVELVKLLHQIASSMLYLENEKVAMVELGLHHLILENGTRLRMMNLSIDGERDEGVNTRAKHLLGTLLDEMVQEGEPGCTRVRSLLGFMADLERSVPLTWHQIMSLCTQVREQLEGAGLPVNPPPRLPSPPREAVKIPSTVWALVSGLGLIGALVFFFLKNADPKPSVLTEGDTPPVWVEIPAGEYAMAGGGKVRIARPFRMNRNEVTLSEYRDFLESGDLENYRHPDQPDRKKSHHPTDWKALWAAAVRNEEWQGRKMSTNCPVVGIDWWDAHAFTQWKGERLPTMSEWAVAANFEGPPTTGSGWGPVGSTPEDVTGAGLLGMAGSVQEWTLEVEVNPAFQLSPKKPVAAGGSFANPGQGVGTRVWLENREVRRSDLGFRTLREN
ncbi:SUMF1/EgtB/PvdO family nonheme iron enzyme [Verrucomicrobiaceae bacterium 227]